MSRPGPAIPRTPEPPPAPEPASMVDDGLLALGLTFFLFAAAALLLAVMARWAS